MPHNPAREYSSLSYAIDRLKGALEAFDAASDAAGMDTSADVARAEALTRSAVSAAERAMLTIDARRPPTERGDRDGPTEGRLPFTRAGKRRRHEM